METIELIKRSRAGDKLAREQVIKENMPLVYSIVKRFRGRGYDVEDLSQIGAIGLIKAVDNFNINFEVKFSTYAVPMISGEIKRFLRDDGMVKVSRTLKENGVRVRRAAEILAAELGRDQKTGKRRKEADRNSLAGASPGASCSDQGSQGAEKGGQAL